tara:strand:+ start:1183 stop:1413 length:231 start_codon:yes stop_codon:yes gene_type:complete
MVVADTVPSDVKLIVSDNLIESEHVILATVKFKVDKNDDPIDVVLPSSTSPILSDTKNDDKFSNERNLGFKLIYKD